MGEHLRNRRIEKRLFQGDLAKLLRVDRMTIQNWERGIWSPAIQYLPRLFEFLGYDPEPLPAELDRKVAFARRRLGLTQNG